MHWAVRSLAALANLPLPIELRSRVSYLFLTCDLVITFWLLCSCNRSGSAVPCGREVRIPAGGTGRPSSLPQETEPVQGAECLVLAWKTSSQGTPTNEESAPVVAHLACLKALPWEHVSQNEEDMGHGG